MKPYLNIVAAVVAVLALAGCQSTGHLEVAKALIEQQGKLDVEREKTRQLQAQADAARAKAIEAGMSKGEMAATVGVAMLAGADMVKNAGGGKAASEHDGVNPLLLALARPPEDAFDKGLRIFRTFTGGVAELAAAASPMVIARDNGKTTRAGFARDVQIEQARQTGETSRVVAYTGTNADVMVALANRQPTNTINTTISGNRDVANDGSTLTHSECVASGGAAAPTTSTGTTGGTQPATGGTAGTATNNCR